MMSAATLVQAPQLHNLVIVRHIACVPTCGHSYRMQYTCFVFSSHSMLFYWANCQSCCICLDSPAWVQMGRMSS